MFEFRQETLMISFILALALNSQAAVDCALEAEQFATTGYSEPGRLIGQDNDGNLIYQVRTNENGGDAAYEVVVTSDKCSMVHKRLLWSE